MDPTARRTQGTALGLPGRRSGLRAHLAAALAGLLALACALTSLAANQAFTVGVVPQLTATETYRTWRPILDELERRTGLGFQLAGSSTFEAFEQELQTGRFDFAYLNPYQLLQLAHGQYLPLVRDHGESLTGVLVVPAQSPVREVRQLDGKEIAFATPNTYAATRLILEALAQQYGVTVRPRFVQSHASVYLNVALGLSDAGGGTDKTLSLQPPRIRNALRVLYRTAPRPPHPFSAHARIPQAVREQARNALLAMGSEATGQTLLARIPIKRIGPAGLDDYAVLDTPASRDGRE